MSTKDVRWQEIAAVTVSLAMMAWFSPWVQGQSSGPLTDGQQPAAQEGADGGQQAAKAVPPAAPEPSSSKTGDHDASAPVSTVKEDVSTYVLGIGDLITIRALDVEEFGTTPYQIDMRGNVTLPLAGRVRASGLTVEMVENQISEKLKQYVRNPQVMVMVQEMRSQPVSVLGAVKNPGVHQLQGKKSLVEMISLAGGLAEDAGYTIRITRKKQAWGTIPLESAHDDESGEFSVAQVNVNEVMNAEAPEKNIPIKPEDVITVPKGDLVYVLGAVKKSGGFVLGERERVTALQALSMAEGFAPFAKDTEARILRKTPASTEREEIAVNLKKILDGKTADVLMQSDDILWIPTSTAKKALSRTAEAGIAIGTGIAIWRR